MQMRKTQGFTLIEMMLVIAVIAIIAALSLTMYRKYAVTARVNTSALEIQQVLEAALAYNVDQQGDWPLGHNSATCATEAPDHNDAFVKSYLPNQRTQSPYGAYYCWGAMEDEDTNGARLFWVAMQVPSQNTALAQRIAAHLPNAVATSDLTQAAPQACAGGPCYVRAEVVQPSATSVGNNGAGIVAIGNCPDRYDDGYKNDMSSCVSLSEDSKSKYRITFPACSTTSKPRVTVFPNFIKMPAGGWPGYTVNKMEAKRTNNACRMLPGSKEQRQYCDVEVEVTYCSGAGPDTCHYRDIKTAGGTAGASYIVACVSQKKS